MSLTAVTRLLSLPSRTSCYTCHLRVLSRKYVRLSPLSHPSNIVSTYGPRITRTTWQNYRYKSGKSGQEDLDEPIQFSTSKASRWTAEQTHSGQMHPDVPWFQMWIVIGSVAAVLIYFCILREENDMDEEIGRSLWERIPGLEKQQLEVLIKYNEDRGLDTSAYRNRKAEIEERDRALLSKANSSNK